MSQKAAVAVSEVWFVLPAKAVSRLFEGMHFFLVAVISRSPGPRGVCTWPPGRACFGSLLPPRAVY